MRILIADDHKLFVEAIRPTLGELGVDDIHFASNGQDALCGRVTLHRQGEETEFRLEIPQGPR